MLQVLSNVDTILQSAGVDERVRRRLLLLAGPAGVCARSERELRCSVPRPPLLPTALVWQGALWPRREFRIRMIIYERGRGGSRLHFERHTKWT